MNGTSAGQDEYTYENACRLLNSGHKEEAIDKLFILARVKKDMRAQWKLGELYKETRPDTAIELLSMSVEQGFAKAMLSQPRSWCECYREYRYMSLRLPWSRLQE